MRCMASARVTELKYTAKSSVSVMMIAYTTMHSTHEFMDHCKAKGSLVPQTLAKDSCKLSCVRTQVPTSTTLAHRS